MPIVFSRNDGTDSVVAVWKIEESEEELFAMLPVTSSMKLTLDKFRNHSRRIEWLASRVLLYHFTGKIPEVGYKESGQPYIPDFNKSISITHTTGYAAIVASDKPYAGIDIERPLERVLRISERFIHANEKEFIQPDNALNYHTLIWCAKETLFKIIATPNVIFNKELEIFPFAIENEGILNTKVSKGKDDFIYQLFYTATTDYYLVWYY